MKMEFWETQQKDVRHDLLWSTQPPALQPAEDVRFGVSLGCKGVLLFEPTQVTCPLAFADEEHLAVCSKPL